MAYQGPSEGEPSQQLLRTLAEYLESCGGSRDLVDGWYTKTEVRREGNSAGTIDTYFFNVEGKRFRSRGEIARFFGLEAAPSKNPAEEEAEEAEGAGDVTTWVQCDACAKWRELPSSLQPAMAAAWTCSMHPDPRWRSCAVPEDPAAWYEGSLAACPPAKRARRAPIAEMGDDVYTVEALLAQRRVGGRRQFLVRWLDWGPEHDSCAPPRLR